MFLSLSLSLAFAFFVHLFEHAGKLIFIVTAESEMGPANFFLQSAIHYIFEGRKDMSL